MHLHGYLILLFIYVQEVSDLILSTFVLNFVLDNLS